MGELLSREMNKPGRQVRWGRVPAHMNVYGNEVANGLAMEGMCFNPLWSQNVRQHSESESTVGLQGGLGSNTEEMMWVELGLRPMHSEELIGEASGVTLTHTRSGCP